MTKGKFISIFLAAATVLSGAVCGGACGAENSSSSSRPSSSETEKPEYLVGSQLKKTAGGRMYLEVEGEPFLYAGIQVRVDGYTNLDGRAVEEMEDQIRLAAEMGVQCVELPIAWADIETSEGEYNFRKFKHYLEWCEKYGVKMEILWFSYNTGSAHECNAPSYLFDDEEKYPQYPSDIKGEVWGEEGRTTFFVLDNENLLGKERLAIGALTDFLYDWETENGNPNVVIGYQVHNETDNFPRWALNDRHVKTLDGSAPLSKEEAWQGVYKSLDSAGKAFKSGKYRAVTRTNFVNLDAEWSEEWEEFAVNTFNLEGIDMLGEDTYRGTVEEQTFAMQTLGGEAYGYNNFAHVAENAGQYANGGTLLTSAITQGYGYLMYCLSMPMYWIRYETNWDWWEQGVLTVDWEDKAHTQDVRNAYFGLKKAAVPLAGCEVNDMSGFNVSTDYPEAEYFQSYTFDGVTYTLSTKEKAIGYVVYYEGTMYAFTDKSAEISAVGAEIESGEEGEFSVRRFVSSRTEHPTEGKLNLSGNCLYKINIKK